MPARTSWTRVDGQTRSAPSPLVGEGWGGGWRVRQRCASISGPPPPTPPHKGEGSAPSARHVRKSTTPKYAVRPRGLALICLAAALMLAPAAAAAGDYYAGKSIDLLIGAPAGGGYDIYARALARHYGRHIPGQPAIIPKNMPGAGSARAAGFISTLAPKD